MKFGHLLWWGLLLSSVIPLPLKAQINPDGTTDTTTTSIDNGIRIDEGNRTGDNLFHSFEQFSVVNSSEAFFNNANDIVNIFSRVTGGDISNIDGLIRANGDANLFLINPAGIVFGENASLNIGGSFFSSTAESIVFDDDVEFSAIDTDNAPLLTVNMPIGLNFGNNPGDISVNGSNLRVNNGETLALFGGNVTMTGGQIIAPGANIELGGLTEAGQISFEQLEAISFPETIARGDVTLTNGSEVNVQSSGGGSIDVNARNLELSGGESGASILRAGIVPESDLIAAQAGDINLNTTGDTILSQGSRISNLVEASAVGNAGDIGIMTNNLSLIGGSRLDASTLGEGDAGAITIEASGTVLAEGETPDGFVSGIGSAVAPTAMGNSGEINITTTNLFLTQGSIIITNTFGFGNAGSINIEASETISADGESQAGIGSVIVSRVTSGAEGNGGEVNLTTTNLSLLQGGAINVSTGGQGNAGSINIEASETISVDGESQARFNSGIASIVDESGVGNSGEINITTANLSLTQGGRVVTNTRGEGNAGAITIEAVETISIGGETKDGVNSGIFSRVTELGTGNSSGMNITTRRLSLTEGGTLSASTRGKGDAGAIAIEAIETISIDGVDRDGFSSGIFSLAGDTGDGNAADINIDTLKLSVANDAEISVESFGQGEAGNLNIQANSIALSNGAALFASTPIGTGGSITLQIAKELILRDNSTISAQALEDANGGNLIIDAESIVAFPNQNNDIVASAEQGAGGNINITTNALFGITERSSLPANNTNDIDASSEFGLDGTVAINELDVNPAEELEELPAEVIDATRLVDQNLCQQGDQSEFIVTGKGGIAPNPSQVRDGEVSEVDLVEPAPTSPPTPLLGKRGAINTLDEDSEKLIVEAQGWMVNDRGILELVAHKTDANSPSPQPENIECPI